MEDNDKFIANPLVVLREEFDNQAILFEPDRGEAFTLNSVGVLVWKCLDGQHTFNDILTEVQKKCENVPNEADIHIRELIQDLIKSGLAGYQLQTK